MSKYLLLILLFWNTALLAQQKKAPPSLKNLRKQYEFGPSGTHRGPEVYQDEMPRSMSEGFDDSEAENAGSNTRQGTLSYSDEDMDRDRGARPLPDAPAGSNGGGGNGGSYSGGGRGSKPNDPEMGKPQYDDNDDQNYQEADSPDMDIDGPSSTFWKTVMIILLIIAVGIIAYLIIKNYKPRPKPIPAPFSPEELNPETITKSELELRLEEAMAREDYRECVRIYFTFILKELISQRKIRWKKEFTNRDYLLQMYKHDTTREFEKSVHIFDLVWYGDYHITLPDYRKVETPLSNYYKRLNQEHA